MIKLTTSHQAESINWNKLEVFQAEREAKVEIWLESMLGMQDNFYYMAEDEICLSPADIHEFIDRNRITMATVTPDAIEQAIDTAFARSRQQRSDHQKWVAWSINSESIEGDFSTILVTRAVRNARPQVHVAAQFTQVRAQR